MNSISTEFSSQSMIDYLIDAGKHSEDTKISRTRKEKFWEKMSGCFRFWGAYSNNYSHTQKQTVFAKDRQFGKPSFSPSCPVSIARQGKGKGNCPSHTNILLN